MKCPTRAGLLVEAKHIQQAVDLTRRARQRRCQPHDRKFDLRPVCAVPTNGAARDRAIHAWCRVRMDAFPRQRAISGRPVAELGNMFD